MTVGPVTVFLPGLPETPWVLALVALAGLAAGLATRASMPVAAGLALSGGACRPNFRGHPVPVGLGVVPAGWVMLTLTLGAALGLLPAREVLAAVFLAGSLTLLGWMDDAWGDRSVRGLRGHLGGLMRGRWSTGGVKALGGVASALISAVLWTGGWRGSQELQGPGLQAPWMAPWAAPWTAPWMEGWLGLAAWVLAAGCMAGTANLINLLDVRPGRAWKALVAGWTAVALALALRWWQQALPPGTTAFLLTLAAVNGAALAAYGPWDLRARVMMGDAGANPLGGLLGLGVVGLASWSLQAAYLLGIVGLHLLSERRSLTQLIEAVPLLRRLDAWGRGDPP